MSGRHSAGSLDRAYWISFLESPSLTDRAYWISFLESPGLSDRAYWVSFLESPGLTDKDKYAMRLREIERLPWIEWVGSGKSVSHKIRPKRTGLLSECKT